MSRLNAFKYLSVKSAIRNLNENTIYFAHPKILNDTLEVQFDLATSDSFIRVIEDTVSKVAKQRGEKQFKFPGSFLEKFKSINDKENHRFQEFCQNIGICSLALRPDHQALWAYYSNEGRGVCFEFDFSKDFMRQHQLRVSIVEYTNKPRIINRADDWSDIFLDLAAEFPKASINDLLKHTLEESFRKKWGLMAATRTCSQKHIDWKHENELRLLYPKGNTALPILKDSLSAVHFLDFDFIRERNNQCDFKGLCKILMTIHRNYPNVKIKFWTFHHGRISSIGQDMDFKTIPI